MRFSKSLCLGLAVAATTLVAAPRANAQFGNYTTQQGNNAHTGNNGNAMNSGPGEAHLRWFFPNGINESTFQPVIDDTDTNPPTVLPVAQGGDGGPYQANPYGFTVNSNPAVWSGFQAGFFEASLDYIESIRLQPAGGFGINFNARFPAYHMALNVPGSSITNPTLSKNTVSTFSWVFTGVPTTVPPITTPPRNYAVYANIPVGPTYNNANVPIFPQEFYVYTIQYGPPGTPLYLDVVDTYVSGGGMVRLGAGGKPNNVVFPFDGKNPITVTLYNVNPLNGFGQISSVGSVVYADAVRFSPSEGFSYSTPTADRINPADPLTTVVSHANNEQTVGLLNGVPTTVTKGVVTEYAFNPFGVSNQNTPALPPSGLPAWRFSPLEQGPVPIAIYDPTTMDPGTGFAVDPGATSYVSPASTSVITLGDPTTTADGAITYDTSNLLTTQTYDIYAYIPGSGSDAAHVYGQQITYEVRYGAGLVDFITVDQSQPTGWTRIGSRRYPYTAASALQAMLPIKVLVHNTSTLATDTGKKAYADTIRFIPEVNSTITAATAHATVNILQQDKTTLKPTKVVVTADENGVFHCLDAVGNPDGTTTEYWSYPSLRDTLGYDPNLGKVGSNGPDFNGNVNTPQDQRSPTAAMPTGFGRSAPLVQHITSTNQDILYCGSSNGRVYAINMAGRGDFNSTDPASGGTRQSGTTTRVWTYPATYPSVKPVGTSDLINIEGSVAYGNPGGKDTIYVPTDEGRIYSIDAVGNQSDESTTLNWTFPKKNTAVPKNNVAVGAITMTPLVYGTQAQIFFGTQQQQLATGVLPGRFFAIDWATGLENWETNFAAFLPFTTPLSVNPGTYPAPLDFTCSPCLATPNDLQVPAGEVAIPNPLIYDSNQNGLVYAIDSVTGQVVWKTEELQAGSLGGLTFTWQRVFDNTGTGSKVDVPVVLVPTQAGTLAGLFARTGENNLFGFPNNTTITGPQYGARLAWQYSMQGDEVRASAAVQDLDAGTPGNPTGWMYAADNVGFLYAFNNTLGALSSGDFPGSEDLVPNNPAGEIFRKAKVALVSQADYQNLRLPQPQNYTYAQGKAADLAYQAANGVTPNKRAGFEWGQTAYILVYNFPFATTNTQNTTIDPPIVNISMSVGGKVIRGTAVQARQFNTSTPAPLFSQIPPPPVLPPLPNGVTDAPMDGYAILAFPLQSSGANSLPPGLGEIDITMSTASQNLNGVQQNVLLDPNGVNSRYPFIIANPIAVMVADQFGNPLSATVPTSTTPIGNSKYNFGISTSPLDPQNVSNGSFLAGGTNGSLLMSSAGTNAHNSTGKTIVWIIDRSMMSLLRPQGLTQGLDNVRVALTDLGWEGGTQAVLKPLNTTYFPGYAGFEDMPLNFPNDSLDYPDIHRQNIGVTKDPNGNSENPQFNGVTLLPPLDLGAGGTNPTELTPASLPKNRLFRPTPFELDISVPHFQPPNMGLFGAVANSAGLTPAGAQGYLGQLNVFVDSVPNGKLDTNVSEAYRAMNLATAVDVDERLSVTTPTVDLGDLPGGSGYSPAFTPGLGFNRNQLSAPNVFQPWGTGNYASIFQPFGVENDGNTNLLDLRIAKISSFNGLTQALGIPSTDTDAWSYLDSSFDVWSNIDRVFAASLDGGNRVFLQKARVQDRVPTTLTPNPVRRPNQNLGTTGTVVVGGATIPDAFNQTMVGGSLLYDPTNAINKSPRIGVSVPFGLPSGKYSQSVTIFENDNHNLAPGTQTALWDVTGGLNGGPNYTEPYTDTGLQLSFNVTETQLTNTFLNKTQPYIDNLSPNGNWSNSNIQPTGARDAFGSLLMAWSTNRPTYNSTIGSADNNQYKIYFASLGNRSTMSTSPGGTINAPGNAGTSPLRDLDFWQPFNSTQWFRHDTGAYPTTPPATLFGVSGGQSLVAGSEKYLNPSFPTMGAQDPFVAGTYMSGMFFGFTGEVQRQNGDGSVQRESRLMLGTATPTGANGTMTISTPAVLMEDALSIKGKPSILQSTVKASDAMIFYPVTAGGQSSILYTRYVTTPTAGFVQSSALPFGSGFESVSSPSSTGRILNEKRTPATIYVAELAFAGKLRGRANSEIYMGRLGLTPTVNGLDVIRGNNGYVSPDAFLGLTPITGEPLTAEGSSPGLFRARGVDWVREAPVSLVQIVGGVSTDLLVPGTGVYDPQTGVASYDTLLGGKVFMDPALGTIRFSNGSPSRNGELLLSYQPKFLRISTGGNAGYDSPTALFDTRLISDPLYWVTSGGTQANYATTSDTGNLLQNDRMIFTYNRTATGGREAARPLIATLRTGVNLPYRLPTLNDGTLGWQDSTGKVIPPIVSLTYADGFGGDALQLDPANGALYFPANDEGRVVTITQYGLDNAGHLLLDGSGNPATFTTTATISFVVEHGESPIPIQTSVNESALTTFLDPFSYTNASSSGGQQSRRPPLLYMLWQSSRGGTPDIYFQSIAPRWIPTPISK